MRAHGSILNNAPPVPSTFIGAPVCVRVPPRTREQVPALDSRYCDNTRHLLIKCTGWAGEENLRFWTDFGQNHKNKGVGLSQPLVLFGSPTWARTRDHGLTVYFSVVFLKVKNLLKEVLIDSGTANRKIMQGLLKHHWGHFIPTSSFL